MPRLEEDIKWFRKFAKTPQFEQYTKRPVAYFCAEYALESDMPTYAGGLGVLAGDMVREASDRNFPLVAVGLYYHEGYICEADVVPGNQPGGKVPVHPKLKPVFNDKGERVIVHVPISDRSVAIQAWELHYASVTVYLLDTNVEENIPADRVITNRIYVGDKEIRLKQECVLGIGGLRLLHMLDIHPSLYHLNEGHSAMLALELIRHEMSERQLGFDEAKQFARRRMVFTNHTLVAAGHEVYSNDLVSLTMAKYAGELGIPVEKIVDAGLVQESSTFSMTMLSLRMAAIVNAVSKLHARKAGKIWGDHPMVPVTNGIHIPTWDTVSSSVGKDGEFWGFHQKQKKELLKIIRERTGQEWKENELLLGWARRIVQYKRPLALVQDVQRFAALARNPHSPVRIVFSGRPHSSDETGLRIFQDLKELTGGLLSGTAVFIPEYNLQLAHSLVSGCDIWLNTPIVGFEACGTSGMKAGLNGGLALTTKDGWYDEVDIERIGWEIKEEPAGRQILDLLEETIIPIYYARDEKGVPSAWEEKMRQARQLILDQFSATRMLREYAESLYV